jgi:hypothetical protein
VACVLSFKGRRRTLLTPGRLTELFFLDEATALAAGHRPCGECRIPDYRAFGAAWRDAYPDTPPGAPAIDARLHADRLSGPGARRTYAAPLDELPDGAMVAESGRAWLVRADELLAWTPGGYTERRPRAGVGEITVITPRGTVAALRAGYRPVVHDSATDPRPA